MAVVLFLILAEWAAAQSELIIADDIQRYEALRDAEVKMYGTAELHLSDANGPLPGSVVNIYDVVGHLVKTLVNDEQPAGVYTVTWGGLGDLGQGVGSGLYFCRLRDGLREKVIKMQFIK